jgi:hypothetical protein
MLKTKEISWHAALALGLAPAESAEPCVSLCRAEA